MGHATTTGVDPKRAAWRALAQQVSALARAVGDTARRYNLGTETAWWKAAPDHRVSFSIVILSDGRVFLLSLEPRPGRGVQRHNEWDLRLDSERLPPRLALLAAGDVLLGLEAQLVTRYTQQVEETRAALAPNT